MIPLFHIENHVIDTSQFSHILHDQCVTKFEEEFAEYIGAKHACSINSATNAIFLALLGKNITVNIPSVIPPVVLNSIINSGNKINFIDDINWVGDSYILHDFKEYKVIDSAQKVEEHQFKAEAEPQDLMLFSFYPTKPIGGIDGGMIVSDDKDKIIHFKEAVLNGMSYASNNWERRIKFTGWKMYLNSFQATIARNNFKELPRKLKKLSEVREYYNKELNLTNTSSHLYRIDVNDNKKFLKHMKDNGVTCGIHYEAQHTNAIYNNNKKFNCPLSNLQTKTTASIPFNEKLTEEDLNHIIHSIKNT